MQKIKKIYEEKMIEWENKINLLSEEKNSEIEKNKSNNVDFEKMKSKLISEKE